MPYSLHTLLFFLWNYFYNYRKKISVPLKEALLSRTFEILISFKNIRKSHSLLIQPTVANHSSEQKTLEAAMAEMHAIEQCFAICLCWRTHFFVLHDNPEWSPCDCTKLTSHTAHYWVWKHPRGYLVQQCNSLNHAQECHALSNCYKKFQNSLNFYTFLVMDHNCLWPVLGVELLFIEEFG